MNVYDDITEATVVSHSVTGHFTTADYVELLIVRTNLLSIYKVTESGKLLLTHEFKLQARITDLALVGSVENTGLNYLLLGIGNCKLSIVKFNSLNNSLETISLHYYEEKFKANSFIELAKKTELRIDPQNRCALLFNNDNIVILPFSQQQEEEDYGEEEEEEDNYNMEDGPNVKKLKLESASTNLTLPSIITDSKKLDSTIENVVDIQFLRNFSRPTLGILYQPKLTWAGNLQLNPLPTKFLVISLNIAVSELEGTVITKLEGLPWDSHTLIPTWNGCVLLGSNEVSYIDNTGVLQSAIFLNSYADASLRKVRVVDHTDQQITLNKDLVKSLWSAPTKESGGADEILLLMDESSNLYYIQLEFEGRLMTKFDMINLPIVNDIFVHNLHPTCITRIDESKHNININLFIGFQTGDSLVVRLNNIRSAIETRHEYKQTSSESGLGKVEDEDEDEDDLYGDDGAHDKNASVNNDNAVVHTVQPFDIEMMSCLRNIGPVTSLVIGEASSVQPVIKGLPNPNKGEYSLVATCGNGTGSNLMVGQISVQPEVELALKFISVTQIWNLKVKNRDKYLITTDSTKTKSDIYEIENNFALYKQGRLRRDATTVYISMFGGEKRIVQVTTNHLYLYDTNFRRLFLNKFNYEVVHVSVMDPYLLITLSRGDIMIFELESKHKKKLIKIDLPEVLKEMVITSGLILKSNMCNELLPTIEDPDEEQMLFTFVTADNKIITFTKNHNDCVFELNGIDGLNEQLFICTYQLPNEIIPDPSIKQIMINKLGQDVKTEYLTVLTFGGEIYQYRKSATRSSRFFKDSLRNNLPVTGAPDNAYAKGVSSIERIMHYVPDYNGYSVIFVTGKVPYLLIKEDDSVPRVFQFANIPLVSMTTWGNKSIMCVDDIKNARVYTLDCSDVYYGNKIPLKRVTINSVMENYMTLTNVAYHERTKTYIVSYSREIDFVAKGEDGEVVPVGIVDDAPHAKSVQSGLLLINPTTWSVIDKIDFEPDSLVNDIKSMFIQLNSRTKRKIEYVVVGTSFVGTEDLPATGSFQMYDIAEVVPEPGKPDTNYKIKQFFKEELRSAVTSVCDISGRFVISQSQKLMVRDAQEDNSVVPVAFLDIPLFTADMKSFGNLLIIGDAMQGIQLVGFDAEPYRMIPLGRSVLKFETLSLEFLVNGGDLYFTLIDRNDILHVLKYAPDEPNSLSGQRLIHCSSFNMYSTTSCTRLIPKNELFVDGPLNPAIQSYQVIGGQADGSLFKVMPVPETVYRRLYVVQQQIIDKETPLAGINPKMERLSNDYYQTSHLLRPMLDYNVVKQFCAMSIPKRTTLAHKLGKRAHFDIWRDVINLEFSLKALCNN
ncbi:cleavage/polyadenylation factor CFT1 KNAG_0M01580 [Huiozyma naganishii CBS 8797]|uniref:Protein CFT1 n=1 Tax=Huiozyma naganishii (strain ATCC MYA-139 / BCRC 22969 / CBS 8797 / KCTC 17520 / NBRC 10181 / NCYC 3082 / Yp74L-3) TaxID=1071383 RepID=J7SBF9_HUIN7|nr:hypothetical protein KNAG_0M01580 [Kazachstania naganishii CBS 8797]CCK73011.1 hypothetical protein KNAG_0M01580 [Kazachstania naganishii CBS 8797]